MEIRAPSGARHLVEYCRGRRLGLSVARYELDAALLELARANGVEVREGCRVVAATSDHGRITGVRLADGTEHSARVVIGADGMHSVVARVAGPARTVRWPRRLGLVTHYDGVEWPEPYGQMWVGQRGYVGVAPLDDRGLLSVGLVGTLGSTRFDQALASYPELAARLGRGQRVEPVIGIGPLARRVRRVCGPGYLLVGDAAGFFDPFTGEGIFRALRGAQLAVVSICEGRDYASLRQHAFGAKERLTMIIQVFVQHPPLLELALRRLHERPAAARRLGNMLGDLEPARLNVVGQLLRP
jgi:flavin-dependent dehydrogenase